MRDLLLMTVTLNAQLITRQANSEFHTSFRDTFWGNYIVQWILRRNFDQTAGKTPGFFPFCFHSVFFSCCVISVECFCSSCVRTYPALWLIVSQAMLVINNKAAHSTRTHTLLLHTQSQLGLEAVEASNFWTPASNSMRVHIKVVLLLAKPC